MTDQVLPAHTKLSASGMERWQSCPGSIAVCDGLVDEESEFAAEGTAAHALAEHCLLTNKEAWQCIGQTFEGFVVDDGMAIHVQGYVDRCRAVLQEYSQAGYNVRWEVEVRVDNPEVHPDFGGTSDFNVYARAQGRGLLEIRDLKYGAGIAKDAFMNPQLLYYAYGMCLKYPDVEAVKMVIDQPRAFHPDGPLREWTVSRAFLETWAQETLLPAMARTEWDDTLVAGEHCRFCPAARTAACPLLQAWFDEVTGVEDMAALTDDELAEKYERLVPLKTFLKGVEAEAYKRSMLGQQIKGTKIVETKSDRVWKPEAEVELVAKFGNAALTEPVLKSPAQIDKLAGGEKLTAQYAYTPKRGYAIVPLTDKRRPVSIKTDADVFANVLNQETNDE